MFILDDHEYLKIAANDRTNPGHDTRSGVY
jgi:hypothetical protein